MWLIDTEHHSLRKFDKPPSRYAILSHVWTSNEQDFQFVIERHNRSRLASKIIECCRHAKLRGLEWVWIDTCCIDKTNSVELSEAINSMFKWYAGADVCFAYLSDAPADEDPTAIDSKLRLSVWFTRGWTLQELIAPKNVVFFSHDWTMLGTKDLLAKVLEDITRIDIDVLRLQAPLSSVSVAKRMSWASSRVTTRVEDAAYCLMGIFDINMPTIYGEGSRAFRRLQEEIMRTSPDQTLFTWGPSLSHTRRFPP
ncbi:heterokaryon incompatibility protein-domain-containing protein [Epithele typhae]|uniref:heterokaryon incompatibility protein-domain-containing protein n=1 Tax=Epithele typhae TaxID=378194 RepID=UPI0020077A09|nr:heterokaryon incompatibility protein-domain-containing protein [Epithele typhae]KAH9915470.1 heterokaryon incompatibility protein-domain-containing protein [Epithele typhae]